MMIPLYVHPSGDNLADWDAVIASAGKIDITVIASTTWSEEGESDSYARILDKLDRAGIPSLAYIPTCYGCGDVAQIKTDISTTWSYYQDNGIDGFFFDQGYSGERNCLSNNEKGKELRECNCFSCNCLKEENGENVYDPDCQQREDYNDCKSCEDWKHIKSQADILSYYTELSDHAKDQANGLTVVINTGTRIKDPAFLQIADVIVTGENAYSELEHLADETENTENADRYAAMLHSSGELTGTQISEAIESLADKNYGSIYMTDESWSKGLPAYWNELIAIIEEHNTPGKFQVRFQDAQGNQQTIYLAPVDQIATIQWGDASNITHLADKMGREAALLDFDGRTNTQAIVEDLDSNYPSAAKRCEDLQAFGQDDWYLPSLGELQAIFQKIGQTPEVFQLKKDQFYWSSTEQTKARAWRQKFDSGGLTSAGLKHIQENAACRCVRK